MKKVLFLLLGLGFFQQRAAAQQKPVVIPGSLAQTLSSRIVPGQEYELQILLPSGYGKSDKRYPVVYLLDSQWDFPLVTALYGQQYFDGFVPELIIVGITWTGRHKNADSLRARDYVPTHNTEIPQSGGAPKFLSFLKNELFPFVESQYRIDKNNRTLMGCSLGGLFTLYALFAEPGLFQQYVAATPAVGWDGQSIYQFEKAYFENGSRPAAKLYLCVGDVERSVPVYQKLVNHLTERGYKTLQIKSQVLENTGHSGTKGEGYARGLQFAFERLSVQLTAEQLKNMAGTYRAENGRRLEIKTENDQPVLIAGKNTPVPLKAASEDKLYTTSEFLNIQFHKDGSGQIIGFTMAHFGGSQKFLKQNQQP